MSLSVKSAERRTGYQIVPLYGPGKDDLVQTGWVARQASGLEVTRAYAHVSTDGLIRENAIGDALNKLCDQVYDIHGEIALKRAGGCCEKCRCCRKNLSRHHIIPRSKGRLDHVWNLRILCFGPGTCQCHEQEEGVKVVRS
jgi:hypothetical protein